MHRLSALCEQLIDRTAFRPPLEQSPRRANAGSPLWSLSVGTGCHETAPVFGRLRELRVGSSAQKKRPQTSRS